jgi:hypothetical protein
VSDQSEGSRDAAHGASTAASQRSAVVLFGASNLTRSFPRVIAMLRAARGPVDVIDACGHGRSYGLTSSVLGRELPSILDCGAWNALAATRSAQIDALITDIGNDIMYRREAATIAGWIEQCVARLRERDARVAISRLPLASLDSLSHARFAVARAIFYPTRPVKLEVASAIARELDAHLRAIARAHGARLVDARREWYGLDPIHIRRSARDEAWGTLLGAWESSAPARAPSRLSVGDRIALARRRPERRRTLGRLQTRAQPSAILSDGTTIASF